MRHNLCPNKKIFCLCKALTSTYRCIYFRYMKAVINVKTDKAVKKNAQKIAEELGLSLSAVINAYLKQFVRNKEAYFSLSLAPWMSPGLKELLGEIEKDLKEKKNLSPAFSSPQEMDNYLDSL